MVHSDTKPNSVFTAYPASPRKHLIGTVAEGYSGELKLNFYRSGVHFAFERGRVTKFTDWTPEDVEDGDAAFPDLTFLQLLCGRCRAEELTSHFVDCWTNSTATAVLLDCLFPNSQVKFGIFELAVSSRGDGSAISRRSVTSCRKPLLFESGFTGFRTYAFPLKVPLIRGI